MHYFIYRLLQFLTVLLGYSFTSSTLLKLWQLSPNLTAFLAGIIWIISMAFFQYWQCRQRGAHVPLTLIAAFAGVGVGIWL